MPTCGKKTLQKIEKYYLVGRKPWQPPIYRELIIGAIGVRI